MNRYLMEICICKERIKSKIKYCLYYVQGYVKYSRIKEKLDIIGAGEMYTRKDIAKINGLFHSRYSRYPNPIETIENAEWESRYTDVPIESR